MAHSIGSRMVLELLLQKTAAKGPEWAQIDIESATLVCPYFDVVRSTEANIAGPLVNAALKIKPDLTKDFSNDFKIEQEHEIPWQYDFENKVQKRILPLETVANMIRAKKWLNKKMKDAMSAHSLFPKTVDVFAGIDIPIKIVLCKGDMIVCNETARNLFRVLPAHTRKSLVELDCPDHSPF